LPPASIAILAGEQKYTNIGVPILAIYALPKEPQDDDVASRFEAVLPSARVVRLPGASHFVFLSNEADVLREMRAFIRSLPEQ
jgi:pimeloyl-ACP methyl ester carboxylesterase